MKFWPMLQRDTSWNRPDTKRQVLNNMTYMRDPGLANAERQKVALELPEAGEDRCGSDYLMGMEFRFGDG